MSDPVKAVSVLVRRRSSPPGDVFLVVARTPQGGGWCPPGGKVHSGEDPKAAAVRELEEETGIIVPGGHLRFVHSALHQEVGNVEVSVFFCEYRDTHGVPCAAEGCPIDWMTWGEICADVFGTFYSRLPGFL